MITSDKQYAASKKQLAMLTKSLKAPPKKNVPVLIAKAGKAQLQELIAEIRAEMKEYDELRNSNLSDIAIHSLDDLMVAPIRYRLASRMSIDTFSRKVGVSATEKYSNINSSTFRQILDGLNINLDGHVSI